MDRCPGCGGMLTSAGCINSDCAQSMGGTYLDGKKVATASGRSLLPLDPQWIKLAEELERAAYKEADDYKKREALRIAGELRKLAGT